MKMTLVSVTSSWLCATGVAVISSYCILTNGTAGDRKKAEQVACSVSKRGTVSEYKSTNRHSSAIKKTTTAKVGEEIKIPKYVPNPIYTPFTNALNNLTEELADIAKDGSVKLANGFVLMKKDGKPTLEFPEEYRKVGIGGVAIGDEFKNAFSLLGGRKSTARISIWLMKSPCAGISALKSRSSIARRLRTLCFPRLSRSIPFGCMETFALGSRIMRAG